MGGPFFYRLLHACETLFRTAGVAGSFVDVADPYLCPERPHSSQHKLLRGDRQEQHHDRPSHDAEIHS